MEYAPNNFGLVISGDVVAAPVRGWRMWKMYEEASPLRSIASNHHYVWETPSRAASCFRNLFRHNLFWGSAHPPSQVPNPRCQCGFWLLKEFDFARTLAPSYLPMRVLDRPTSNRLIIGEAEGWGSCVEGEHGWRVQYARPVVLYVPEMTPLDKQYLESYYGCVVHPINRIFSSEYLQ